jgi:mono/diheme cytochrome c family protein
VTLRRHWLAVFGSLLLLSLIVSKSDAGAVADSQSASDGWTIPKDAAAQSNPIALTPALSSKAQSLYKSKCQRCHGAAGRGDGPDADPEHSPGDLTDSTRASRNPDGVIFYKVWNGRSKPKMPAFKTDISREDVWTLVHYVKTLRKP